jgi:multidrug efflux pump
LIVSQMLTLFTTPVMYLAFDSLARRVEKRGKGEQESKPEPKPEPAAGD